MANEEQLAILKQGVYFWNEWRDNNPKAVINLMGADLILADLWEADLAEVNLRKADLTEANLRRANLADANLVGAHLMGTYLTDADLRRANLTDANLVGAHLMRAYLTRVDLVGAHLMRAHLTKAVLAGANLTEADLTEADLTGTDLTGANLEETVLTETNFNQCSLGYSTLANIDFSACKGLERVDHNGPSHISTSTIHKSKGKIPIKFLRGCGLSDLDIEYAKLANPDLTEKEITDITYKIHELRTTGAGVHYFSVFISYSFSDQEFAAKVHSDLQNSGVRCWFAPHDIQGGKKIHEQIDTAIQAHDRLLLILSEKSMNSEWVKTEIANARQKELSEKRQVLFPISIVGFEQIKQWKNFDADTGKDSAREIREYFIPDFSNWKDDTAYQSGFNRLLQDLKA